MIRFNSVSKRFGNVLAVNRVSFTAKKGEIIGFLGPNGAGKTTTMRLILGILSPTEGEINVEGLSPTESRISVVKRIGYLPENNPLYKNMSVSEYLKFIADVKKDNNWKEVVESVGLNEKINTQIGKLSRGYKQRVGLAAALISNPQILILDEPTSGLDPLEQDKIKSLIKKIGKNKTIIFSTHILSEAEDVVNRVIIINEGKIMYDGSKPKRKGGLDKLFRKVIKGE